MISVLILTKNEEQNLRDCIETLRWSDDIHVLDSFSTDRTVEIARELGAHVYQQRLDTACERQNWSLENIPFKYPWVFYSDADERVTPELARSMIQAVENPGPVAAFEIVRRDFFLGTWLKHTQTTSRYLRLFRPDKMRYERRAHPVSIVDGPVGKAEGYLDHYPFSKGLAEWVEKHNKYSTQEAEDILDARRSGVEGEESWSAAKAIFARDFTERRRNQKQLYYHLPGRPLIKFLIMYFLKRGFLDGRAGLAYSILIGFYEYLIVLKTRELDQSRV